MSLILLYLEFFKIGIFAVGGGLATLPFLFEMANDQFTFIQQTGWLSSGHISNFLAIAQCSPGAIGVNVATLTGYLYGGHAGGIAGGILAALGLISPAIIVISIIAKALQSFKNNKTAVRIFAGLRPAAAGLLCAAGWGVCLLAFGNSTGGHTGGNSAGENLFDIIRWREILVCIAIFFLIEKFKWHPVVFIALGAVAGILLGAIYT
jgi:chromate transporter